MSKAAGQCIVFGAEELLPESWRKFATDGPVRTFNPGLVREADGWIFAYRIVASDGCRRIGICRLNSMFEVISGSQVPLTDQVCFRPDGTFPQIATQWFADPRLYRFGDRLFIYWNSGWHEPGNHQFVHELDGTTLIPIGNPRELVLRGKRQKLEKNWTFFTGADGSRYAVYSITPHRVLRFSLDGDGDIFFDEASNSGWSIPDYPPSHGGLRGGAPPCFADGQFWSFCHSVHDALDGYRYAAACYSFGSVHPFSPTAGPIRPLDLGGTRRHRRTSDRLNTAVGEVIYPCGAARDGARWVISHGINDEFSAISIVDHADVLQTIRPVDMEK